MCRNWLHFQNLNREFIGDQSTLHKAQFWQTLSNLPKNFLWSVPDSLRLTGFLRNSLEFIGFPRTFLGFTMLGRFFYKTAQCTLGQATKELFRKLFEFSKLAWIDSKWDSRPFLTILGHFRRNFQLWKISNILPYFSSEITHYHRNGSLQKKLRRVTRYFWPF